MTFSQKLISVEFTLTTGTFLGGAQGSNSSGDLTGHRVSARILKSGGQGMGQAEVAIYGLPLDMMNRLTTLGKQRNFFDKNIITIKAGDTPGKLPVIFKGNITTCFADMRAMPEVCLRVSAHAGMLGAVQPPEPISMSGSVDVAQVMGTICKKMDLTLENNGVSCKIKNLYLPENPRGQALQLAQMANINWLIDGDKLAIWNKGESRKGSVPLISPETGMVGYPAYTSSGLEITTAYDPSIIPGGAVEVKSDLTPACGKWNVFNLEYQLDSLVPRGKWFNKFDAQSLGAL